MPRPEVNYAFNAVVERVLDGDTAEFTVDWAVRRFESRVRMRIVYPDGSGFGAKELRRGTPDEKLLGAQAKARTSALLPAGSECVIRTFKPDPRDSFGRWLAAVWPPGLAEGEDVATILTREGLGGPWSPS